MMDLQYSLELPRAASRPQATFRDCFARFREAYEADTVPSIIHLEQATFSELISGYETVNLYDKLVIQNDLPFSPSVADCEPVSSSYKSTEQKRQKFRNFDLPLSPAREVHVA